MGDFDSVKLGVCEAYFWPLNGTQWENLGLTKGGCAWKYSSKWHEVKVDQYGDTPVDAALLGEAVSAKVPMAESDFNKLKFALTAATVIEGTGVNVGKKKLTLGSRPGMRLQDRCGLLRLHPISAGDSLADDVIIYKAGVANSDIELPFKVDNERVLEVEFIGLIDRSRADGSLLCQIGDIFEEPPQITLTGPEDDATVAGFISITGNAVGAIKVEFWLTPLDGAGEPTGPAEKLGEDTLAPWEYYFDTSTKGDGDYELVLKAFGRTGLITTTDPIVIHINNEA